MMKLEERVTSLELSKRLKELGVKQESLFYWCQSIDDSWHVSYEDSVCATALYETFSAFTVAELGELLPTSLKRGEFMLQMRKANYYQLGIMFDIWYDSKESFDYGECKVRDFIPPSHSLIRETKESDARAKLLIYLIENNLLKA